LKDEALQDQFPHNHCFGCGPHNRGGLNLKSYWAGHGPSIARFAPAPHHCSATTHFVNGGIIATLIDCHSICTAMAAGYIDERRAIGSEPGRYFATSKLEIDYRRPTPMDAILELEADIAARHERGYTLECRLRAAGKLCAVGSVEAVAVSASWMGLDERPSSLPSP
jgi:acyl-coenzyme A thioesterase PaaI-like protein